MDLTTRWAAILDQVADGQYVDFAVRNSDGAAIVFDDLGWFVAVDSSVLVA